MPLANLDEKEREVVRECLRAAVEGPFFPDWEFQALFGLERKEVRSILKSWPNVDETAESVRAAINDSFNNLLGYPHGNEKEWPEFITVSPEEVLRVYRKWCRRPV